MKFLLLLVSLSSFAWAHSIDPEDCDQQKNFSDELLKKISGKNTCLKNDNTVKTMISKEYQANYGHLPQVKKKIIGYNLEGPAPVLNLAIQMLGELPPKTWNEAAKDCKTVLCAFEKLFHSKDAAMEMFNIKAKSGYYLSLDQTINKGQADQIWSAEEIREIDAAISKIPKELKHLNNLTKIDRIGNNLRRYGHDLSAGAYAKVGIPAQLGLYDTGLTGLTLDRSPFETTSWPQEVLIHELCHHHDFQEYYASDFSGVTSEKEKFGFKKISGWNEDVDKEGKPIWNHTDKYKFVRDYAGTSPKEDYAESCMNYLLHPNYLESIDPKKYEYMKNNVFDGIEYKDKVWNDQRPIDWPSLNKLVADDSSCLPKVMACSSHFQIVDNKVCYEEQRDDGPYMICGQDGSLLLNQPCIQDIRTNRIIEIGKELTNDSKFCELGGGRVIQQQTNKICKSLIESVSSSIDKIKALDLKANLKKCEDANDFTASCPIEGEIQKLKTPTGFEKEIERILSSSLPDRYEVLATKLKTTSSKVWLQGCFKGITTFHSVIYTDNITKDKSSEILYSSIDDKKFMVPITSERSSKASRSCSKGMIESFKELGHKTPEEGDISHLINDFFKAELNSFENEVLSKIDKATSGCILKKCKIKIIQSFLMQWEQKSPEQRAGVASDEFSSQLASKIP